MGDLLPCPLCGAAVELHKTDVLGGSDWIAHVPKVGGHECPLEFSAFGVAEDNGLVELWNRRAPSPAHDDLIAALETLSAAFDAFTEEANWAASRLSADTIRKVNEAPAIVRAALAKASFPSNEDV